MCDYFYPIPIIVKYNTMNRTVIIVLVYLCLKYKPMVYFTKKGAHTLPQYTFDCLFLND